MDIIERFIRLHPAHLARTKRERRAHQKAIGKAMVGIFAATAS
ncbi:hypothetical protein [Paraburkholderia sp. BCC1876]|nr:hypothetical protein [Paraburkholderia sp. BCC1876]